MNKNEFDQIIKENLEVTKGEKAFGYMVFENPKVYNVYYSKHEFEVFKEEMKSLYPDVYQAFFDGKGSELKEHIGRYGFMPPKMASVASSSRFCYLALRNGAKALGGTGSVIFEHECRIADLGIHCNAPQLDAYIKNENIFIEVKCHEIFDLHSIIFKNKYWNLIYGENNQFGFQPLHNSDKNSFDIPLSVFGLQKKYSMFDIKQLICHLLGIASQSGTSKKLVYLFFIPKSDNVEKQKALEEVFINLQQETLSIFNSNPITNFCSINNIELCAVVQRAKTMEELTLKNMRVIYPKV